MSGYNCTIEYIAGTTNTCADFLSRYPDNVKKTSGDQNCEEVVDQTVLDVNDNLYEINVLDSTQFEPKSFASCDLPNDESFEKCDCLDFRKGGKDVQKHYLLVADLVYYLPNVSDDPCLKLFIPKHIRNFVVKQYHDQNGRKTFDSICQKCNWPNLFKEINKYVSERTIC